MLTTGIKLIALSTLMLVIAATSAAQDAPLEGHPLIGQAAPTFVLQTSEGDTLDLAELRGQYVVIHFGTSW